MGEIEMKQRFTIPALAAGAVMMAAVSASAATVTVQANAPESWGAVDLGATTALSADATWTTQPSIVSGSVGGQFKSPFDPRQADNGSDVVGSDVIDGWEQLDYFTIGSPNRQGSPGVLALSQSKSILSLLWGSVDTYNAIELVLDGTVIDTVSGQDVFDAGGEPAASGAALVKISGAGLFDEVRFYSNFDGGDLDGLDTPAFEFSNVVAAVPLPAGGWLLITALGGMAVLRRKRKAA